MKKNIRHMAIIDLITNQDIETQEDLANALKDSGLDVTQATISRDIKELNLIKITAKDGKHKYAPAGSMTSRITERQLRILNDSVLSIEYSGNLIVIKTMTGSANAAAESLDALGWKEIIGSIAGDNTILLIISENQHPSEISERLRNLLT
jgi:transcriptional regulator of arginine metabolism